MGLYDMHIKIDIFSNSLVFQHYWKITIDITLLIQQDLRLYKKNAVTIMFFTENSMKIGFNMA